MCFPLKIKTYRYGADGQRALKYVVNSNTSTMYFNKMWQVNDTRSENVQSKHIFVGETRIATKINSATNENTATERVRTYYYHSDHLGSAQTVTNWQGNIHERLEYTPYGETWIDWRNTGESSDKTPFRFTAKERDEETGLYYFGARYLDARTSRWLSVDPALGEYVPAPGQGADRLPGMGGIFNYVNMHVYHYAGNNPIKYIDPSGRDFFLNGYDEDNNMFINFVYEQTGAKLDVDENGRVSLSSYDLNNLKNNNLFYNLIIAISNEKDITFILGNRIDTVFIDGYIAPGVAVVDIGDLVDIAAVTAGTPFAAAMLTHVLGEQIYSVNFADRNSPDRGYMESHNAGVRQESYTMGALWRTDRSGNGIESFIYHYDWDSGRTETFNLRVKNRNIVK